MADTPLLGIRETRQGYRVRRDDRVIGVILPATARDGYSGDIRALVGIRNDGSIAGVRVVAHRETPGLGDKVDLRKSDWIRVLITEACLTLISVAGTLKKTVASLISLRALQSRPEP